MKELLMALQQAIYDSKILHIQNADPIQVKLNQIKAISIELTVFQCHHHWQFSLTQLLRFHDEQV